LSRLTGEAEKLVRAGRAALKPSDADRERVFEALLPHLGGSGGGEGVGGEGVGGEGIEGSSTVPAAAASATLAKVTAALVAVCVAGAGIFVALRTEAPPASPAAIASVTLDEMPRRPVDQVPESAPLAAPPAQPSDEKRVPAAPRPADSLAQEVAMLSQASAELHAGRPAAALNALDEHRRKFPRGELAQERTSARIQALCALGRMSDAQAELARLARMSPSSPHLARARKACGSGTNQKD
jgi:hypothetical protein